MADSRFFDEARAKAWTEEVQGELEQVKKVMKEVDEVCATSPAEDDTIMNAMAQTGKKLRSKWDEMDKYFNDVIKASFNIIKVFVEQQRRREEEIINYGNSNGR